MLNIHIISVPEGEEKETHYEKVLEDIIARTSLTWKKKKIAKTSHLRKFIEYHTEWTQRGPHWDTYWQKLKAKKNTKSNKEKATNNIQGNFHKVIGWFSSRNSGQKGMV